MIHYTLLPEKEIKSLKREYRIRLVIFMLFFVSCSILTGVIALIPAYYFSYSQEKISLARLAELQNSRQTSGFNDVLKELSASNDLMKQIKSHKETPSYSKLISKIIGYKNSGLTISSFAVTNIENAATTTVSVVIQGKSTTRESLIQFKDMLETDPMISNVELPVSDLAKSKNISYSIKISIIPTI